jgi:hypothetical protein
MVIMQGIGFDFPKQIQTKSSVLGSYIYISYRCFLSKDTSFIAVQFYGNFQISGDMNYLLE